MLQSGFSRMVIAHNQLSIVSKEDSDTIIHIVLFVQVQPASAVKGCLLVRLRWHWEESVKPKTC